jgi:methylmalonyl-CoA mutase
VSLTEELAQAAWAWFQEIEAAGGVTGGLVAERLAATWTARREAIAHRRDPITGVSEFPNLDERRPARATAPEPPGGGLPRIRYAQDFERLRDAADAAAERPRVFLAVLGSVAQYTARATFAANLFQSGGIETVLGTPGEFAGSGTTVACLCSADKVYADEAPAAARALRDAGATTVWLAGKGDHEGVDATVFAGCDALDVLRTTLDDLGVAR